MMYFNNFHENYLQNESVAIDFYKSSDQLRDVQ